MKNLLGQWWSQPVNFEWIVANNRSNPVLRFVRFGIGTWTWVLGILCVVLIVTADEPTNLVQSWTLAVLAVSAAVAGSAWVFGPWPTEKTSKFFILYAETGIAIALLAIMHPLEALPGASLFAVVGAYITICHGPRMFVAHQAWAATVSSVLFARTLIDGHDRVFATSYFVTLLLVLFSAPVLTQLLLLRLRQDAAAAFFDPLTGLSNRRGLDAALVGLLPQRSPVAMVIDLDDFKSVNDIYGHAHGDMVLRRAATAIYSAFPPPAVTARTGGEEFAVIVCEPVTAASDRAERLRLEFAEQANAGLGYATVSIGLADSDRGPGIDDFEQLLELADAAMYTAKRLGGNAVIKASNPTSAET